MQTTAHTEHTTQAISERARILILLEDWIHQRPGLDPRDYGGGREGWSAYRSESRSITRDLHHARALLSYVARHESITAERLRTAFATSYSGRLSLTDTVKGVRLDYCTGQYWPTEYRRAACAVLASAIWDWMRDECMPARVAVQTIHGTDWTYNGMSAGDFLRRAARRELGAAIAQRWFN